MKELILKRNQLQRSQFLDYFNTIFATEKSLMPYKLFFTNDFFSDHCIHLDLGDESEVSSSIVNISLSQSISQSYSKSQSLTQSQTKGRSRSPNLNSTNISSFQNSSKLSRMASVMLRSQLNPSSSVQTLVIDGDNYRSEMRVCQQSSLLTITVKENSLINIHLFSIQNNPLLHSIVIHDNCAMGGDGEEALGTFQIQMNSSLKTITIGNNCFCHFEKFDLNSMKFHCITVNHL